MEIKLTKPADLTIVTGAAGWLGQGLLSAISRPGPWQRNGTIRALVRDDNEAAVVQKGFGEQIEIVIGDVRDERAMSQLTDGAAGATLIHAAGIIHPKTVSEFGEVNTEGTRNVLNRASHAGVRRFVYISSNSPFGVNPTVDEFFRAEEPYRPYMGYGKSKQAAEIIVKAATEIETVIVRPPWFYGPFQPARQTRFFTLIRTGKFPLLGRGDNRRSMVYIDNLVQGVLRADLVKAAAGQAYWIADTRPYDMNEIIATVRAALNAEGFDASKSPRRLPAFLGDVAEKLDGILQSRGKYIQEIHVLSEMNKTIACDTTKAREELGYEPEVELLEGMRASIRWCVENGLKI